MGKEKGFWVVEYARKNKTFEWWFPLDGTVDQLSERIDLISRTAVCFWSETSPSQEERELYLMLMRAVRSEKARALLTDLLS
jgi:hypothetical protein